MFRAITVVMRFNHLPFTMEHSFDCKIWTLATICRFALECMWLANHHFLWETFPFFTELNSTQILHEMMQCFMIVRHVLYLNQSYILQKNIYGAYW